MAYRCACIIPILFSIIAIIQGLFQIGIHVYFEFFLSTKFFKATYSTLWAGIWEFLAAASLIFVFANGKKDTWRKTRVIALILFISIAMVQVISWITCEVLQFRLWLDLNVTEANLTMPSIFMWADSAPMSTFIWAYLSALAASIVGVIIGFNGSFYIFIIFYRLGPLIFKATVTERVQMRIREEQGAQSKNSFHTPPAVSTNRASQTSTSWQYMRQRCSTPKNKAKVHPRRYSKKKRDVDLDSISSIHKSQLEFTQQDFDKSAPLRMIAMMRPEAVGMQQRALDLDLRSPSLDICFSPKESNNNATYMVTPGQEMKTFFNDDFPYLVAGPTKTQSREAKPYGFTPPPPPPPPPPTPADSLSPFKSTESKKVKPRFVLPEGAWRLPEFPQAVKAVVIAKQDSTEKSGDQKDTTDDSTQYYDCIL